MDEHVVLILVIALFVSAFLFERYSDRLFEKLRRKHERQKSQVST